MKKRDVIFLVVIAMLSLVVIFVTARSYARKKATEFYLTWQEEHILDHEKADLEVKKELEEYKKQLQTFEKGLEEALEITITPSEVPCSSPALDEEEPIATSIPE